MTKNEPLRPASPASLAARAALALVLMVGFYGLALAVSFGLLWIPYAMFVYAHRVSPKIALFCIIGAFIILKSILPRRDIFTPPGPRLLPSRQPRLFRSLGEVAAGTGQEMPAEVYLIPDVNAWVSQRGGIMGLGSRRIMGLGLPLLQILHVSEFRAVLAHEFGHYHGGEVKLGPWIYKTRQALVRTLQGLAAHSSLISKPFEAYAALFFRVTHAISRSQELRADALAAQVAGGAALARGLRAVHGAGQAFVPYWRTEVDPVLNAGFLPPLAAGFARFVSEPKVARAIQDAIVAQEREGLTNPYDTHPPLKDRLAALDVPGEAPPAGEDPLAISLLEELGEAERRLLAAVRGKADPKGLKSLAWDEVGSRVHLPRFEAFLRDHAQAFGELTAADVATLDWAALGKRVAAATRSPEKPGLTEYALGAALSVALVRSGFSIEAPPGAAVTLVRGEERVEPFSIRTRVAEKGPEDWRAFCSRVGIADTRLASLGAIPVAR